MNKIQQGLTIGIAALTSSCAPFKDFEPPFTKKKETRLLELNANGINFRQESEPWMPNPFLKITEDTSNKVAEKIKTPEIFLNTEKIAMKNYLKNGHDIFLKMISDHKLSPAHLAKGNFWILLTIDRREKKVIIDVTYNEKTDQIVSNIDIIKSSHLSAEEVDVIHQIMREQDKTTNEMVRKVQSGEIAESDL